MKRLLCLYKPANDKNYPWALKHPKVKSALALFKSRKDAMNWFLNLGYDCATYFQTDKKVFGGLFISEKNSDGVFEFEINTERYDGNVTESEILNEFHVIQKTGLRDEEAASKYLDEINDYIVLRDHENYFPVDDDFVLERKKNSKDEKIEELEKQINELEFILQSNKVDSDEISTLLSKLNDTHSDKEALQREIEILRARAEAYSEVEQKQDLTEVVKQVPVEIIKEIEVIKEVPVEVIREVEVIKEVPVNNGMEVIREVPVEIVKEVHLDNRELIKYFYIKDLSEHEQLESLAFYSQKIEKIADKIVEEKTTSIQDLNDIKFELSSALSVAKDLKNYYSNSSKETKLLKLITLSLTDSVEKLSTKLFAKESIEHTPENFVYVENCKGENLRLAQLTSYIIYNKKYVAFVEEINYSYAFVSEFADGKDQILLFTDYITTEQQPTEQSIEQPMPVETKQIYVKEDSTNLFWAVLLFALSFGILITLVFMLWLGYVPPLN